MLWDGRAFIRLVWFFFVFVLFSFFKWIDWFPPTPWVCQGLQQHQRDNRCKSPKQREAAHNPTLCLPQTTVSRAWSPLALFPDVASPGSAMCHNMSHHVTSQGYPGLLYHLLACCFWWLLNLSGCPVLPLVTSREAHWFPIQEISLQWTFKYTDVSPLNCILKVGTFKTRHVITFYLMSSLLSSL